MAKIKSAALASAALLVQWQQVPAGWVPQIQQQQQANASAPLLYAPVGAALKTAGALWVGTTARRIQLYETEFSQTGSLGSTDCQCQWQLSRFNNTAAMAGSTVVANLYDPADVATLAQFLNATTAEPTYTGAGAGLLLKLWAINQRGSYRWRTLDDGDNILIPATIAMGVGLGTLSGGGNFTASAIGSISFIER